MGQMVESKRNGHGDKWTWLIRVAGKSGWPAWESVADMSGPGNGPWSPLSLSPNWSCQQSLEMLEFGLASH
jgi:hypothetical protein